MSTSRGTHHHTWSGVTMVTGHRAGVNWPWSLCYSGKERGGRGGGGRGFHNCVRLPGILLSNNG